MVSRGGEERKKERRGKEGEMELRSRFTYRFFC